MGGVLIAPKFLELSKKTLPTSNIVQSVIYNKGQELENFSQYTKLEIDEGPRPQTWEV